MTALMLTMLLGFAALAVDVSTKYRVRTESQATTDAAALAGAWALRGTANSLVEATQAARDVGQRNRVYTGNATVTAQDVVLGRWNSNTHRVDPATTPADVDAVSVVHREPSVAHPFAMPLTGTRSSAVRATAVARATGPSSSACAFPMAIGNCTVRDNNGTNCGGCMRLGADQIDNIGWSLLDGSPSSDSVTDALKASCFKLDGKKLVTNLDSQGRCAGVCARKPTVKDPMNLGNGSNLTSDKNHFCELMKDLLRASPTGTVRTELPVFDATSAGGACDPKFTGSPAIVGFAEMEIFGVSCKTDDKQAIGPEVLPVGCEVVKGSKPYILARIACGSRSNSPPGSPPFGVYARPVLAD